MTANQLGGRGFEINFILTLLKCSDLLIDIYLYSHHVCLILYCYCKKFSLPYNIKRGTTKN